MDKWLCYIKPTRKTHSSGFRMFEVGYCVIDENNKVKKKMVVSTRSDAVRLWGTSLTKGIASADNVSMDLTRDGYIRIWSNTTPFRWEDFVGSDAVIRLEPIDIEWCEREWKEIYENHWL